MLGCQVTRHRGLCGDEVRAGLWRGGSFSWCHGYDVLGLGGVVDHIRGVRKMVEPVSSRATVEPWDTNVSWVDRGRGCKPL